MSGVNERGAIVMSDAEVTAFIDQSRTATLATIGVTGRPHLIAMWYAVVDGDIWFETKAKSQKVLNIRRDRRASVLIEAGDTYETLRGVSLDGFGAVDDDPEKLWRVGVSVWERYIGPYTSESRPLVEAMLSNRVAIRFDIERVRSWDHSKLRTASSEATPA